LKSIIIIALLSLMVSGGPGASRDRYSAIDEGSVGERQLSRNKEMVSCCLEREISEQDRPLAKRVLSPRGLRPTDTMAIAIGHGPKGLMSGR